MQKKIIFLLTSLLLVFGVFLSSTDVIAKDSKRSFIKNPKKFIHINMKVALLIQLKREKFIKIKRVQANTGIQQFRWKVKV